jgi:hypothetical protein
MTDFTPGRNNRWPSAGVRPGVGRYVDATGAMLVSADARPTRSCWGWRWSYEFRPANRLAPSVKAARQTNRQLRHLHWSHQKSLNRYRASLENPRRDGRGGCSSIDAAESAPKVTINSRCKQPLAKSAEQALRCKVGAVAQARELRPYDARTRVGSPTTAVTRSRRLRTANIKAD